MAVHIEQGKRIENIKDANTIANTAERQFAHLLLTFHHLLVWHEATLFQHTNGDGKQEATLPDFRVINTKTGQEIYIEITTTPYVNGADCKTRQKRVMQSAASNTRYVVLYKQNLTNIQTKNKRIPNINFFSDKK